MRAAHAKSHRRYGAPRVHRELRAAGVRVAKKRVARLMREDGLVARRAQRRVRTTDSAHAHPVAPNVVARDFAVADQPGLDRTWVSDFTYVPTREGWLFLAVVLDLASRRVVGWAVRETMETELVLAALHTALADRRPAPGLVCHSDRGSQYASGAYRALLAQHGAVASMSGKGDCWDNAVAESVLRDARTRAAGGCHLRVARGGAGRHLRLHHLVQRRAAALESRLRESRRLRAAPDRAPRASSLNSASVTRGQLHLHAVASLRRGTRFIPARAGNATASR